MKFVALVSGGKDSIYSILQCIENGHTLIGCIHLGAPAAEVEESYMYQTAASEVIQILVEECLRVPLILYQRRGKSIHTSLIYNNNNNDNQNDSNNDDPCHDNDTGNDEVEDMYNAIQEAMVKFPDVEAISSGAILSTYQRIRIEQIVCNRCHLHSLAYLWRKTHQIRLLQEMIHQECIDAVLVRTAAPPGLIPQRHLNQSIRKLQPLFLQLYQQYQFHVCGEGGEYETLVLHCPKLYHNRRLVLDQVQITDDDGDGTGNLRILQCHTEPVTTESNNDSTNGNDDNENEGETNVYNNHSKSGSVEQEKQQSNDDDNDAAQNCPTHTSAVVAYNSINNRNRNTAITSTGSAEGSSTPATTAKTAAATTSTTKDIGPPILGTSHANVCSYYSLPHVRHVPGGFFAISEIMSPIVPVGTDIDDVAIQEAMNIFHVLQATLQQYKCTAIDVVKVYVYLSRISLFSKINCQYKEYFGTLLPPSRCCVAVDVLPGNRNIMLDCYVQCGSGQYLRSDSSHSSSTKPSTLLSDEKNSSAFNPYTQSSMIGTTNKLRNVLHVQSISYWAPVCVGPYSQVNTIRDCIHYVAGQIGLIPEQMTLQPTWELQVQQAWMNIANILDALDGGSIRNNILCGLIYMSDSILRSPHPNRHLGTIHLLESISKEQIRINGNVKPGWVDNLVPYDTYDGIDGDDDDDLDGYEDKETMLEMQKMKEASNIDSDCISAKSCFLPLLVVAIPEMPVGALIEIDITATTQKLTSCLHRDDYHKQSKMINSNNHHPKSSSIDWDTGHDFPPIAHTTNSTDDINDSIIIDSYVRCVGSYAISVATVTASIELKQDQQLNGITMEPLAIDTILIFKSMLKSLEDYDSSVFDPTKVLQIRLYHVNVICDNSNDDGNNNDAWVPIDDGTQIRANFHLACASHFSSIDTAIPAVTVTPVRAMHMMLFGKNENDTIQLSATDSNLTTAIFAFQVISFDPVHSETCMWIHQKR